MIAIRPVVAAAGEQPHGLAVPAHDQPVAVVLDLVHPVGTGGRLGGQRRNARVVKPIGADAAGEHAAKIGAPGRLVESQPPGSSEM
jgi:hypothetical protein